MFLCVCVYVCVRVCVRVKMDHLLTSRENDLILVKKDFLVRYMRSSSASSPSIIAQLSAVGSSHSLPPESIISLEYLYCNLQVEDDGNITIRFKLFSYN